MRRDIAELRAQLKMAVRFIRKMRKLSENPEYARFKPLYRRYIIQQLLEMKDIKELILRLEKKNGRREG
jgi:hypothetical protein